jgi:hypothetical protein
MGRIVQLAPVLAIGRKLRRVGSFLPAQAGHVSETVAMKRLGMGCVVLALGLTAPASAQELQWRPVNDTVVTLSAPVPLANPPAPLPAIQPAANPPRPIVRAQAPDPLFGQPAPTPRTVAPTVIQVAAQDPLFGNPAVPPPPAPPVPGLTPINPAEDAYNCGQTVISRSGGGSIFDQGMEAVGSVFSTGGRSFLQSDHCFDIFSSPITNPFFFEDPRSLTQIKPLFIWQQVPHANPAFEGGDIFWYGVTGSVAITDWFSVVINKLGVITLSPHTTANGIRSDTGFSEFSLGPQFTFIRSEQTKTVVAAGVLFDMAIGSGSVIQDTGDVSFVPYISAAQNFGRTDYGSFNYMTTLGYSVASNHERNDFFYWSNHLDFDVMNLNKIFPTIELNWFHTTSNGRSNQFFGFNGADLINFGAQGAAGLNDLSLALGARYKFTEWFQSGVAVEIPLVHHRDIYGYRITFDLIFRY